MTTTITSMETLRRNPAFVEAERQAVFAATIGNRDIFTKAMDAVYEIAHVSDTKTLATFVSREDVRPLLTSTVYVVDMANRRIFATNDTAIVEAITNATRTTSKPTAPESKSTPAKPEAKPVYSGSRACYAKRKDGALIGAYPNASLAAKALGIPTTGTPAATFALHGYELIRVKDMPRK